jgi:hypothetical protein
MKDKEQLKVEDPVLLSDLGLSRVFAHPSYEKLISTGVGEGRACDTQHPSNKMDIISLIVKSLSSYL